MQNSLAVRGRDFTDDDLTIIDALVGVGRGSLDFGIGEHLLYRRVREIRKCGHGVEEGSESENFGRQGVELGSDRDNFGVWRQ